MNHIGDLALLGDCHSAALVGRDGAVEWACFPRFDSPSVFARLLDPARGGALDVTADGGEFAARRYIEDTNVLVTDFTCERGAMQLIDCMPVDALDASDPHAVRARHSVLRCIRCEAGEVHVRITIAPRFEYGLFVPRFRLTSETMAEVVGGADALWISATRPLQQQEDAITASWHLRAGEEAWVEAAWSGSHEGGPRVAQDETSFRQCLETTIAFWRRWIENCAYDDEHVTQVRRSALTLKALTYAPSGAVVAAPTTSLPEALGGIRNWDYRFTWIRDSTLTLISLFVLGLRDEAADFKTWLERTGAGRPQDLQIMYGICGERTLPERELDHLAGHRGSAPVRVGNGAVKQMQLDAYGQLLEAGYLFGKAGGEITLDNWSFLAGLADIVCARWREPDHGIWEMRDEPRHFVHSKLNCWVALDRAVRMATSFGFEADADRWAAERDHIRAYLMTEAAPDGWFHQAVGRPVPDAATLLVPASGFLPTTHPLVEKTIEVVLAKLHSDGLVHRYVSDDGLSGGEGAFLLCSFWLLDCLIHSGRLDEAERLLERLLGLANDVGLYAEEVDASGEALGNFPQAFTHMALVLSCSHLSAAKRGQIPFGEARAYAELALDRLLEASPGR